MPLRLAERLGDVVTLDAPVRRIEQRNGRAIVHTGRGVVRAKRVVVAAPPPLVLDIDWFPQLPTKRLQLLRHLDMGQLMKCDAIYRRPFWRDAGLNGFGINDSGAARAVFDNSPKDGTPGVLLAFVGGATWRQYGTLSRSARRRAVLEGFAAMFGEQALHPVDYVEHDWTREQWTRGGPTAFHAPGTLVAVRPGDPAALRPGALGRHRDLDVLERLHGRRRARRGAGRDRGRGPAVRRVLAALAAAGLAVTLWAPASAPVAAEPAAVGTTRVFSLVPAPRFPAYVHAHTNGRVYAGTYVDSGSTAPSKVFEWTAGGTLLRSWRVPGQVLDADHGVQVAAQTRSGRLVLLETSTASILTLDVTSGRFTRVVRLPDGAVPNYATWGPGGALFVTDFAEGVIWKVPHGSHTPRRWFTSPALSGVEFGTTGIRFRPGRGDLLITQQTASDGAAPPTDGHLYRLPIRRDGRPGELATLWTSQPGDLPDGFGIGRSGHVYVALAGLANQLVELTASGEEVRRFGTALTGDNGSPIPFDTPCSATFLGRRVLVANQSAVAGDATHQAILDSGRRRARACAVPPSEGGVRRPLASPA